MLKIASLAALTAYERFMEKLTRMWPTAWHLVYSADDKCRAEHLERIRRSENVRHPTAAWVASGARSELLTPEETYGSRALPGGKEALRAPME
eukprot:845587-Amphidinium_carterae.1